MIIEFDKKIRQDMIDSKNVIRDYILGQTSCYYRYAVGFVVWAIDTPLDRAVLLNTIRIIDPHLRTNLGL